MALFAQVVDAGSFAGAARRLGVPANTVSRRIQDLEASLGVRLMQRSTRRLALTDAGQRLYEGCADKIEALTEAIQAVAEDGQALSGRVRVAVAADFFDAFQLDWIGEFLAAHPRLRLDFVQDDARADLIAQRVDLALRGGAIGAGNVTVHPLGVTREVLAASPGYLAARGRPGRPQDLADHDCVALTAADGRQVWRLDGPEGPTEVEVEGRFSANTRRALARAACAGLGIALLPAPMARRDLEAGRLEAVLPQYGRFDLGVHWVSRSRRHQPKAVRAVMTYVSRMMLEHGLVEAAEPPATDRHRRPTPAA